MPKLSEILFGKKEKVKKLPTVTPEQQELFSLLKQGVQSGEGPFADIFGAFDESKFESQVSQPSIRQFERDILPRLREKFASGDQYWGSGRQRYETKAATELQDRLSQLMYGARQQREQNRSGALQNLMGQRLFQPLFLDRDRGLLEGMLAKALPEMAKSLGGSMFGGSDSGGSAGAVEGAKALATMVG